MKNFWNKLGKAESVLPLWLKAVIVLVLLAILGWVIWLNYTL